MTHFTLNLVPGFRAREKLAHRSQSEKIKYIQQQYPVDSYPCHSFGNAALRLENITSPYSYSQNPMQRELPRLPYALVPTTLMTPSPLTATRVLPDSPHRTATAPVALRNGSAHFLPPLAYCWMVRPEGPAVARYCPV